MSCSIVSRSARTSWTGLLILPMLAPLTWAEPTQEELEAASLLASRATFGMTYDQIVEMAEQGLDEWLDEQLDMECTPLGRWEKRLFDMYEAGEFDEFVEVMDLELDQDDPAWDVVHRFGPFDTSWYMTVANAPDQLCQRVAWALSQIFAAHTHSIPNLPYAHTSYYDILLEHALGSYRELVEDVTYSSHMGEILGHLNNSRSRSDRNRIPDESFARELMQLFSIGLLELDLDGTSRTDSLGEPISSYDRDDVANLARVMTGLGFGGEHARFDNDWTNEWDLPMVMFNWHHDKDEKVILDTVISAGQDGRADIDEALDAIHEHPNVGPFIGRQLIQRLVTSNPEPEYVRRVAEAFNDDGRGARGNLRHVVKTILTDPEANEPRRPERFGKLREPVIRVMNLHRMFPMELVGEDTRGLTEPFYAPDFLGVGNQRPLDAPSVFNFYSPFHSPKGDLSENGLVAPEFQIFDMLTSIRLSNILWDRLISDEMWRRQVQPRPWHTWFHAFDYEDENGDEIWWHPVMHHDIADYEDLSRRSADLVDRLDLVMTHGSLNSDTRERLVERIDEILPVGTPMLRNRVWFAIWYISSLPDYIVESH